MAQQFFTWGGGASTSQTQAGAGTGTSDNYGSHQEIISAALFILNVTAAAAAAGDTLDVWVQHSWDDGTTFDDFLHFTQVLGNGSTLKHLCAWTMQSTAPAAMHKAVTKTLTAAASPLLGPIGPIWRAQYTTATAGTANFTWSVSVQQYGDL
jgi:hypothetical protein